ncbi:MAG: entry exclusion protein TrbK [Rhizobiales bacterium 24-66-13]|jgi:Ti type entry exclusion protein TrbK|nr:MAG: entry exclusion protein TrbK [Rhizobiales bacterium 24-66-13]OZB11983.1 MAG: entry exclusion protein TrbK [Rhizobiales bacterium 39-66-18]HQS45173.1 entry exclusion protein TrbK [Xanthobacteraceae bacterium]
MVSRSKIILVVIAIVVGAGVAMWTVIDPAGQSGTPAVGKTNLSQEEQRMRDFFAAPKAYDTRNGQEMKPRW